MKVESGHWAAALEQNLKQCECDTAKLQQYIKDLQDEIKVLKQLIEESDNG